MGIAFVKPERQADLVGALRAAAEAIAGVFAIDAVTGVISVAPRIAAQGEKIVAALRGAKKLSPENMAYV